MQRQPLKKNWSSILSGSRLRSVDYEVVRITRQVGDAAEPLLNAMSVIVVAPNFLLSLLIGSLSSAASSRLHRSSHFSLPSQYAFGDLHQAF